MIEGKGETMEVGKDERSPLFHIRVGKDTNLDPKHRDHESSMNIIDTEFKILIQYRVG